MQHHLSDVMRHVDQGREVVVTRRRRAIARLGPVTFTATRVKWPDFAARTTRSRAPRSAPLSWPNVTDHGA